MRINVVLLSLLAVPWASAAQLDFNKDVRPILSDKCFACHGPDEKDIKGGLRLDVRELALKPAKSKIIAIVPGKPDASELVKRIFTTDEDDRMPPEDSHKSLSAAEKETLRRWIADGAPYEGHWAFSTPIRPAVPTVPADRKAWVHNPVDAFIVARLVSTGLEPQAEASRETLIRRVTLDLTGIPPTQVEVDAFLADQKPEAYERVVDRLLASPRFGEHMAARWLDSARYADSHGFQTDSSRTMWPWRDWVINAFNANMPFDQFTIEQLAGDLLPNPTQDQLIASGFNRNHRINGEGGIIAEEWRIENVIDRVETLGSTWMALTLTCARCHDHKYDPISQREFYQLFDYFNNVDEKGTIVGSSNRAGGNPDPFVRLANAEQEQKLHELSEKVKEAEQAVTQAKSAMPDAQATWEKTFSEQLKHDVPAWKTPDKIEVNSRSGATFTKQSDGSWLASGKNPKNDTYDITITLEAGTISGILLTVLPDKSLPNESVGRAKDGSFILSDIETEVTSPEAEAISVRFTKAAATYQQKGWDIAHLADKQEKGKKKPKGKAGWAVDVNNKSKTIEHRAMFLCTPITVPEQTTLTIRLIHNGAAEHNIGRFSIQLSDLPPGILTPTGIGFPEDVRAALAINNDKRSKEERNLVTKFYTDNIDNPVRQANATLAAANKKRDDHENSLTTVMVMRELTKPRETHMLIRGEYDKPGDLVKRALPDFLPPLPKDAPNNRLGLAQWLVNGKHPLTARVWVNRVWEQLFGTGIVKTVENLGSQADFPSHPALLDWLASEFVEPTVLPAVGNVPAQHWDMKAIIKLLVTSATYRQSAVTTPKVMETDPQNKLFARAPRVRLSAEMIRDQALSLSGLLVEQVGGPSVHPYMPPKVWDETSVYGNMRNYKADKGDGLYRRTLYTVWKRTAAPPTMLLFDAPSREICTVTRSRTNTPLQALALLNEVTYVEAARALASRILLEGGSSVDERLHWGWRQVTARAPTEAELTVIKNGLNKRLAHFKTAPDDAKKLISEGASTPPKDVDPIELAAYTTVANVLLNLDEVINRE